LIIGLNAVLNYFNDIGLDGLYKKHSIMSEATRKGFQAIGLESFAPNNPSTALSAIMSPDNIDAGIIVKELKEKYGIIVAGGQDQAKGKIFRITHMGDVHKDDIISVITAVENILENTGFDLKKGLASSTAEAIFK
jgi:aspartate aminotransferase-like enzyme